MHLFLVTTPPSPKFTNLSDRSKNHPFFLIGPIHLPLIHGLFSQLKSSSHPPANMFPGAARQGWSHANPETMRKGVILRRFSASVQPKWIIFPKGRDDKDMVWNHQTTTKMWCFCVCCIFNANYTLFMYHWHCRGSFPKLYLLVELSRLYRCLVCRFFSTEKKNGIFQSSNNTCFESEEKLLSGWPWP